MTYAPSNAPTTLRASPSALMRLMTVTQLERPAPHANSPRRLAVWPPPKEGLSGQNLRGLVYFMGILVFASLWFPYKALAWLSRLGRSLARYGDWLLPKARACHHDLLYQTLAPLAGARRLLDPDATLTTYEGEVGMERWWSDRLPAPSPDRISLGWSYTCRARPGATLKLDMHEVYDPEQTTTHARVRLERADGSPMRLPPTPDGWELAERSEDGACIVRWTAPTSTRLDAMRGRTAPDADRSAVWAAWVGALIERNGLAGGGEAESARERVVWSRATRSAAEAMAPEPRDAPLVGLAQPARPTARESLRGLAPWLRSIVTHSMVLASVAALVIGGSYGCMAFAPNDAMALGALMGVALVAAAWWSTARFFLPRFTRRRVRLPERRAVLAWDGRALRLGDASVQLDRPFTTHLSYSAPRGADHDAKLHVELRPARDAQGEHQAVRFSVAAAPSAALKALPRLERDWPQVHEGDFIAWLWPLLRTRSAMHGESLAWEASDHALGRGVDVEAAQATQSQHAHASTRR